MSDARPSRERPAHERRSREEDLELYLRVLAGKAGAARNFDVRWAPPGERMRRRFVPALRVDTAAALIRRLAARADVYVGVALRDGRRHGGRGAIGGSHLLFIECDERPPVDDVGARVPVPTMEIASGTEAHRHLYWRLAERAPGTEIESANLRLALALGGDRSSVDLARVLRPPGSLNHKHDPPRPVRLLAYRARAVYALAELTAGLPRVGSDVPGGKRPQRAPNRTVLDLQLLAIPAAHYVQVLTARTPDRTGKIACPFHDDRRPSLQLYADGSFYCFGCRRGGTIYDFASHIFGVGTRGSEFLALREQLRALFAIDHGAERLNLLRAGASAPPRRPPHRLRGA